MGFFSSITKLITNPVSTLVSGLAGSALDYIGGDKANSAAQASTREQMEFQKEMSSTAHQREVEDLKKAGLNPVLSAGGSGSSTPSGSSYTPVNEFSSAKDAAQRLANLQLTKAQTAQTVAGTAKTVADTRLSNLEGDKQAILKSPYEAASAAIPKIKSTAKDAASFYSGSSPLSPSGIYDWAKNGFNSSSARDMSRPDTSAIAKELKRRGVPMITVRPLPKGKY